MVYWYQWRFGNCLVNELSNYLSLLGVIVLFETTSLFLMRDVTLENEMVHLKGLSLK